MNRRLDLLLIAPYSDGTDVGESWSTFEWARRLSERHRVTMLNMRKADRASAVPQLPGVEVVEWHDPAILRRFERFGAAAKPGYLIFHRRARAWIRASLRAGRRWDLVHQVAPLAIRYASPAIGLVKPLVIGPLAGSVPTPASFRGEFAGEPWYMSLRGLDAWRVRHDRSLRRTYREADVIVGVAPYVQEFLRPATSRPFRFISETGPRGDLGDADALWARRRAAGGPVKFLYVGRIVRSKGLRDAIRAFRLLPGRDDLRFDVVGDGNDRAACEREAAGDPRIRFHGKLPRADVDAWYEGADAFLFPSFREPSGNVVYEAMGFALPMIVADAGGPSFTVDDASGLRVAVRDPDRYARDLADAIARMAADAAARERWGRAARARVEDVGLWDRRIERMEDAYELALAEAAR
jgi:glycosyltransferase involved in cell wall biosynthesis